MFMDLIDNCKKVIDLMPWSFINQNHHLVILDKYNYTGIEIKNNIINIYPNNNNFQIYHYYKTNLFKSSNIFESFSEEEYINNQLEYFQIRYDYLINLNDKINAIYYNNDRYIYIGYKNKNQKIKSIEVSQINQLNRIINILLELLTFIKENNFFLIKEKVLLYKNKEIITIKNEIFLELVRQKINYSFNKYKTKNKIRNKELKIDLRYLGEKVKEDFKIVFVSYDETKKRLLIPLGMNEFNINHLYKYLDNLFEKGIYKRIKVYNIELYEILNVILNEYEINITLENDSKELKCILDDYERILVRNNQIKNK